MKTARKILHMDLDAFFCAVEELADPSLRGKPFAVGGSPDGRGVVCSCETLRRPLRYGDGACDPSLSESLRRVQTAREIWLMLPRSYAYSLGHDAAR